MTPPRSRAGRARPGGPITGRSSFSPCLALRWCRLVHAVEVALERIDTFGPEPAELIQPVINLLEWLWLQAIETALCVHRGFDETGVAQHAQVLGHSRLRHPQPALDLSHRLLGQDQEAQDRAAVGSAMMANADSMVLVYFTGHIRVKAYTEPSTGARPKTKST